MSNGKIISSGEAAAILGTSPWNVWYMATQAKRGERLPSLRVGNRLAFRRKDILRIAAERRPEAGV